MLALAGQQVLAEGLPASPPAALVMNTHITGLAVARSLGRTGVPVVGLDDGARPAPLLLRCPRSRSRQAGR